MEVRMEIGTGYEATPTEHPACMAESHFHLQAGIQHMGSFTSNLLLTGHIIIMFIVVETS